MGLMISLDISVIWFSANKSLEQLPVNPLNPQAETDALAVLTATTSIPEPSPFSSTYFVWSELPRAGADENSLSKPKPIPFPRHQAKKPESRLA